MEAEVLWLEERELARRESLEAGWLTETDVVEDGPDEPRSGDHGHQSH
jgi:hypothetical protein